MKSVKKQYRNPDWHTFLFLIPRCTGDESVDLSSQLETAINIGEHAFTQMQGDMDRQRLLGERPLTDPLADIMLKQMQQKER